MYNNTVTFDMHFNYYYNNVPKKGLCRNNLIYTSLISKDKKTFCQWFFNDKEYHKNQNQVVDPALMQEKWDREIKFLTIMEKNYPDLVPEILDIDDKSKKLYLKIEGEDFWEKSNCNLVNYKNVCENYEEQILKIIEAHYKLGIHKYSMHPSSFFVVDGHLKSINYFFSYFKQEENISIKDVESHIYITRQTELKKYLKDLDIDWNSKQSWYSLDKLCWYSFQTNYPKDFIDKCLNLVEKFKNV